eukprot:CAMPEP_0172319336 /NCGR_PEP_ID=MMETSP1058-20130122/37375_1 /TAXON_ID=83371 /ORGANISM="Detonula confervacea, Strain CCMP 353" /LENGTH=462 /DNA_ID=CAMNT_0013034353 /DNA_START=15 /DNA_END=1403 /DNA_ORIENTATION=+
MRSFSLGVLALAPTSWGFSPPRVQHQQQICHKYSSLASSSTQLHSVPTSIDTFTSGLASIARLPRGVTVSGGISSVGPAASFLPTCKKLYDVENNRDCRTVRERISELDIVIEQVIPATKNSRAVEASASPIIVPTLVAQVDGKEVTMSGMDEILEFFDDKFCSEKEIIKKEELVEDEAQDTLNQVKDQLLNVASYLPGILRAGRGSSVCGAASSSLAPPRPQKPLILYSYEGNQFCRLVREVLTELDIVYELQSAGKGSPRREELASITGGSSQCPFLIDPNTGVKMGESADIVEYLYEKYALWTPPNELLRSVSGVVTPLLAPVYKIIAPLQAGSNRENEFEYTSDIAEAKAEIYDEISSRPVVIYTYELSPFCSEAVALLKSTGTNFKEVSLGQEWIPGLIKEPEKRAALLAMTGQSSLPHIFVGGTSIGGLYSGSPGLVPALEGGELMSMVEEAKRSM